jgi:phosphoglycolate phosphatase-like HAD superfamily hydrolase
MTRNKTAFLFDLDGTLIDGVYQHVLAWKSSLDQEGIPLSVWRIHRKIDMIAAQRARGLGVGLLSGGYGEEELARAGAFRVYEDPADLLKHIDEVAARG